MDYRELVHQLRAFLGLAPCEPAATGSWTLQLDTVEVTFHPREHEPAFSLRAMVGVLDDEALEPMAARLLAANLVQSCSLGADANGTVYLTRHVALQGLSFDRFKRLLEGFVSVAEYWQAQLAPGAADTPPAGSTVQVQES